MKKYTKRQIREAIAYWKDKLRTMNESNLFKNRLEIKLAKEDLIGTYDIKAFDTRKLDGLGFSPSGKMRCVISFSDERENMELVSARLEPHPNGDGQILVLECQDGNEYTGHTMTYAELLGACDENDDIALAARRGDGLYVISQLGFVAAGKEFGYLVCVLTADADGML